MNWVGRLYLVSLACISSNSNVRSNPHHRQRDPPWRRSDGPNWSIRVKFEDTCKSQLPPHHLSTCTPKVFVPNQSSIDTTAHIPFVFFPLSLYLSLSNRAIKCQSKNPFAPKPPHHFITHTLSLAMSNRLWKARLWRVCARIARGRTKREKSSSKTRRKSKRYYKKKRLD